MGVIGRHLAEVAGAPASHGQQDLEVRVGVLEGRNLAQAGFRLDVKALEVALDVSEGIVDVGQECGVRHGLVPVGSVTHDDITAFGDLGVSFGPFVVISFVSGVFIYGLLVGRRGNGNVFGLSAGKNDG